MRIPEPDVPSTIEQFGKHDGHGTSQLWVEASSCIPGQWETWWCRSCRAWFDRYTNP